MHAESVKSFPHVTTQIRNTRNLTEIYLIFYGFAIDGLFY